VNLGVTGGAEGDELVGGMDAGPPVVDVQPAMEEASHPAGAAAAFVAFEDGFAVAGEVGAGVSAGAVAAGAEAGDGGSGLAAGAEQGALRVTRESAGHWEQTARGGVDKNLYRNHSSAIGLAGVTTKANEVLERSSWS